MGLKKNEYERIVELLGREPNWLELSMFAVMWSEHCAYKHSRKVLKLFPTEANWVIQGPGENAGVVDIGDGYAVAFKMESHNHPSAIEPYQGAATGIGGIVRDILSMGARPIALLDPLRFGDLSSPRTKYLFEHVVAGIADYGNCIGVPTVGGDLYFDPSYTGNPIINVMCVGLLNPEKMMRSAARGVGNVVLLIGSKTGRDGIHGATFASEELDERSEERRPSVQVGDPFTKKLLIEACLELVENNLIVALQDLGAAGLTSSSCEMATKGGVGIDIDISRVPRREENMEPYEVMLSESQERMLAIVEPEKLDSAIAICDKWELDATPVGKVTDTERIRVFESNNLVGDIKATYLTEEAPVYEPEARKPLYLTDISPDYSIKDPLEISRLFELIGISPNTSSRKWVYEQYDHMVQINTVVRPGSDAAVLRIKGTNKAVALTVDGNSRYIFLGPYEGGKLVIAESLRNLIISGARPLAITDCLNFGNPEDPEVFYQFNEAVRGMADALKFFRIPVVSGNVSFYNESNGMAIFPTPVVGAVGVIDDVNRVVPSYFTQEGTIICLIGETEKDYGGSEIQFILENKTYGKPPVLDLHKEKALQELIFEAGRESLLLSAHDLSEGGLAAALVQSASESGIGFMAEISEDEEPFTLLFSETPSRVLVTVCLEDLPRLRILCAEKGIRMTVLGQTGGNMLQVDGIIALPLEHVKSKYERLLGELVEV